MKYAFAGMNTRITPRRLRFGVIDTGIGMTEEQIGRIFQPFSQADVSTTRRFGGTGLGLCISKHLAEALGGDIEVDSEAGKGSRFTVTIDPGPAELWVAPKEGVGKKAGKSDATASGPQIAEKSLLDRSIPLAENSIDNQRLIWHLLERAGAQVVAVDNGQFVIKAALAAERAGRRRDSDGHADAGTRRL